MMSLEDPLSLLEEFKRHHGVEEPAPPYSPSVIIPNSKYRPEWTELLSQAGFLGNQYGRVA